MGTLRGCIMMGGDLADQLGGDVHLAGFDYRSSKLSVQLCRRASPRSRKRHCHARRSVVRVPS
jgi:hypothetical protein